MRLCLFHATTASVAPIEHALRREWPAVPWFNLLDDGLSQEVAQAGGVNARIKDRFLALTQCAVQAGATGILFTCSAFGDAIDHVKQSIDLPCLKPNEAMIEEALAAGRRIALLATVPASLVSMVPEFQAAAAQHGKDIALTTHLAAGAWTALHAGDQAGHDAIIADAAAAIDGCDILVLTQFSMAAAAERIAPQAGRRVLTTPVSAVRGMRALLGA